MAAAPAPRLVGRFPLLARHRYGWSVPLQCGFCGARITYGEVIVAEVSGRLIDAHPECWLARSNR